MKFYTEGYREEGYWNPGEQPWFFKRVGQFETPDPDGSLFFRNGQQVTVIARVQDKVYPVSLQERLLRLEMMPYRIRFPDGSERVVFETDLYDDPSSLLDPKHLFDRK